MAGFGVGAGRGAQVSPDRAPPRAPKTPARPDKLGRRPGRLPGGRRGPGGPRGTLGRPLLKLTPGPRCELTKGSEDGNWARGGFRRKVVK